MQIHVSKDSVMIQMEPSSLKTEHSTCVLVHPLIPELPILTWQDISLYKSVPQLSSNINNILNILKAQRKSLLLDLAARKLQTKVSTRHVLLPGLKLLVLEMMTDPKQTMPSVPFQHW